MSRQPDNTPSSAASSCPRARRSRSSTSRSTRGGRRDRRRASRITDLHLCGTCDSELVYPVDWEEVGSDALGGPLRCPNCEWTGTGVFEQAPSSASTRSSTAAPRRWSATSAPGAGQHGGRDRALRPRARRRPHPARGLLDPPARPRRRRARPMPTPTHHERFRPPGSGHPAGRMSIEHETCRARLDVLVSQGEEKGCVNLSDSPTVEEPELDEEHSHDCTSASTAAASSSPTTAAAVADPALRQRRVAVATTDALQLFLNEVRRHPLLTRGRSRARQAHRAGRPRGQGADDQLEPAPRRLDRQEVPGPRAAAARPHPGGHLRADPRGREVRLAQGLQVLHLRDVLDPPGDPARDREQGAHDPHPVHSASASARSPRAERELAAELGRDADRRGDRRGGRDRRSSDIEEVRGPRGPSTSLDRPVGEDGDTALGDLMPADGPRARGGGRGQPRAEARCAARRAAARARARGRQAALRRRRQRAPALRETGRRSGSRPSACARSRRTRCGGSPRCASWRACAPRPTAAAGSGVALDDAVGDESAPRAGAPGSSSRARSSPRPRSRAPARRASSSAPVAAMRSHSSSAARRRASRAGRARARSGSRSRARMKRQRDGAVEQVGAAVLAGPLGRAADVEHVVEQLEGEPDAAPERAERRRASRVAALRARRAGRRPRTGARSSARSAQVALDADAGVPGVRALAAARRGERASSRRTAPAPPPRRRCGQLGERAREQQVAGRDRRRAPGAGARPSARRAAARRRRGRRRGRAWPCARARRPSPRARAPLARRASPAARNTSSGPQALAARGDRRAARGRRAARRGRRRARPGAPRPRAEQRRARAAGRAHDLGDRAGAAIGAPRGATRSRRGWR